MRNATVAADAAVAGTARCLSGTDRNDEIGGIASWTHWHGGVLGLLHWRGAVLG